MKKLSYTLPLVLLLSLLTMTGYCSESEIQPNTQLDDLFLEAGITGTFVLYDVHENRFEAHNTVRAEKRFIPASTFKIPNSLIGLASGAIESVDEVLPYGGESQYLEIWEQDMGLRDAIKISNVPVYQELARRIGLQQMSKHLSLLHYGNMEAGEQVDLFWLQGPLEISALEQTVFLAGLAQGTLPVSKKAQASVREITLTKQGQNWRLHSKTGWANAPEPHIGWWVGWVERGGNVYSFALNMDMPESGDSKKRIKLGKACLRLFGLIP